MADTDPLSFALEAIRVRDCAVWHTRGQVGAEMIEAAKDDVPRLLAAIEAVLKLHTEAVIEDMQPPQFHYCSRCSGHPAWPCPEVQAIARALTGEGETGG